MTIPAWAILLRSNTQDAVRFNKVLNMVFL
ncbi:hypothetical protein MTE2_4879 [Klebsiella pneumoniae VA360]|nr:hypothetical protein MTE2_4879 [Klebsiella pneumoniae VA360]